MSAPVRLIIFDVDGTLIDSQGHIVAAMAQAFAVTGHKMPPRAEILSIIGLSLPQAFGRLCPELSDDDHDDLVAAYKNGFNTLITEKSESVLYPYVPEILSELGDIPEYILGVATGKSRRGLDRVLKTHGLAEKFFTQQVADDHPSKPNPSMIFRALSDASCAPENAVMIGDTSFDMDMARAAGVHAIGVNWGYHDTDILARSGAHKLLDDFREIPAALTEIWRA